LFQKIKEIPTKVKLLKHNNLEFLFLPCNR
jgi:hypothetical protein